MQSMQKAGIGEGLQTEKDEFSNQFPEKRKKHVRRLSTQGKDEGIDLTLQQQFAKNV